MFSLSETGVVIMLSILSVRLVFHESVFERAASKEGILYFRPVGGLRVVFAFGIPMFLFTAYKVSADAHSKFDWLYTLLYLALVCLIFLSYPGTISVGPNGINYRRYLGFVAKQIKWEEVSSVVTSKVTKTTTVYANDGISITHSQFNVDPSRFQFELKARLGLSIIER
jgi:hypothetical protein